MLTAGYTAIMTYNHRFSELELLNLTNCGTAIFCRDDYPELEAIEIQLESLRERGYISQVIRASKQGPLGARQLVRVFVIGPLTERGTERRKMLGSTNVLRKLLEDWSRAGAGPIVE
jgi:hypothetical protein